MKRIKSGATFSLLFCLVVSLVLVPLVFADENSWKKMTPVPSMLHTTIGTAVVEEKIYYIGGTIDTVYDIETNAWTSISPMPVLNRPATVVACQNKIYVIGGNASIPTQVYDPATDLWENKTSIPTSREFLQANVVDGKIYVISGQKLPVKYLITETSNRNDVYDPETDSWAEQAHIPVPVACYASAVLDDKIYIIGGGVATSVVQNASDLVQIFDPQTNQWANGTSLPVGVFGARACATSGVLAPKRIYVMGGVLYYNTRHSPTGTDKNQVYDPETGNWTFGTPMPTVRWRMGISVVNDEIYVIGGYNGYDIGAGVVSVNEKFTPLGYIPEFSSWIIMPLLLTGALLVLVTTKKLNKKQEFA